MNPRALRETPRKGGDSAVMAAVVRMFGPSLLAMALFSLLLVLVEELLAGVVHGHVPPLRGAEGALRVATVLATGDRSHPASAWPFASQADAPAPGQYWLGFGVAVVLWVASIAGMARLMIHSSWGPVRPGFAGRRERRREASIRTVRDRTHVMRPSLAATPTRHLGPEVAGMFVGCDARSGAKVWLSRENSMNVIAPPGEGKTLRLLLHLSRHTRGPQVIVSSKPDLLRHTAYLPEFAGRPMWVVDFRGRTALDGAPLAELGVPRSMWSLVAGCERPVIAELRADALVMARGNDAPGMAGIGSIWKDRAMQLVYCALHAAAISGEDARWVHRVIAAEELEEIEARLRVSPVASQWTAIVAGIRNLVDETRSGITFGAAAAVQCLDRPDVLDMVCPQQGDPQIDWDQFYRDEGRVFVLASTEQQSTIAPLVTAFVESLVATAKARGERMPNERLDPPLAVIIDEMRDVCPLRTAQSLVATGRGRGITAVYVWQTFHQLYELYGENGAGAILGAATATMVMRGLRDERHLEMIQRWLPEVVQEMVSHGTGHDGKHSQNISHHWVPAMTAADIRQLEEGTALLFLRGARPMELRLRGPWELPAPERRVYESAEATYVQRAATAVAARRDA